MTTEIFRCVAGSNLFGTAIAGSDIDYKRVHLPTAKQILLQQAATTKHIVTDAEDNTSFPLHHYLQLLCNVETNAVEMLFAPNHTYDADFTWETILFHRNRLLWANKKSFICFGKAQAMRYAVRGQRLDTLVQLLDVLNSYSSKQNLHEALTPVLLALPGVELLQGSDGIPQLSVFGRQTSQTVTIAEAISVYSKPLTELGKRTNSAAAAGGADWKGLYHALRIVDEGIELFSTGGLRFPCRHADLYKQIRLGELPLEQVLDVFETKLVELERLPVTCFGASPDLELRDSIIAEVYEMVVRRE